MKPTEVFWAGEFGNEYTRRNVGRVRANLGFFSRALFHAQVALMMEKRRQASLLELGCGAGENLEALVPLFAEGLGQIELTAAGIELNEFAVGVARAKGFEVTHGSFLEVELGQADIVLTKGVLIHVAPEDLQLAYRRIYAAAERWILLAEYYNPTPVEVTYRGHAGRLWKRDFAGELLEQHPDLRVINYGFAWRRDQFALQDDLTWFLLEKR